MVAIDNLKELYCSYNEIKDISPVTYLQQLEVLDLEANLITDFSQINYLNNNTALTYLIL
jgi:Leucine-rich repeat (LRR) protein